MFDEMHAAIERYQAKWKAFVSGRKHADFFESLRPISMGWKTEDLADFDRCFAELRDHADQIHLCWLNERWLATIHLRDKELPGGITIIKLMQRRPGSTDAVGLDHLDFFDAEPINTTAILQEEADIKWTDEENGICKWTSIWFDNAEAKLRADTVIDVCIAELQEVSNKIRGPRFRTGSDLTSYQPDQPE